MHRKDSGEEFAPRQSETVGGNKMKKIVLIIPFFGKFNSYYNLWLKSCEYNETIDWLIFTDQKGKICSKNNIKVVELSFSKFKGFFQSHFDFKIALDIPYKLCDFKPAYGEILQSYITDYDFWGYCDMDVIFGDIRKFITDEILNSFDKVLKHGHFTLIRNDKKSNAFYKIEVPGKHNYKEVFSSPAIYAFDEWGGISVFLELCGIKQYYAMIYADVNYCYDFFQVLHVDIGYTPQVFIWNRGRLFRKYYFEGKVLEQEFMYIHLQKRNMKVEFSLADMEHYFLIGPHRFFIEPYEQYQQHDLARINLFRMYHKKWLYDMFLDKIKSRIRGRK